MYARTARWFSESESKRHVRKQPEEQPRPRKFQLPTVGYGPTAAGNSANQPEASRKKNSSQGDSANLQCDEDSFFTDGSKCARCLGLSYVPIDDEDDEDNEAESLSISLDRLAAA
jgi:hypothetical protein